MRRFYTLTAATLVLGLALPALALAQKTPKNPNPDPSQPLPPGLKIPKNPPPGPPMPPPATSLEMTVTTGDVEQWQTDTVINLAKPYSFRWKTTAQGVTGATWQVIDAATAKVIGSGTVTGPFQAGSYYRFSIDLKPILPAKPGDPASIYNVAVEPQANGQNIPKSSVVVVKYAKPDGQVVDLGNIVPDQVIDKFEKNLKAALDPNTVGYEYAIYVGQTLKKSGGGGYANQGIGLQMGPNQRMVVASMSKTITAAAVMRALEIKGPKNQDGSPDTSVTVKQYLPSGWTFGTNMDKVTFRNLLQHKSGFPDSPAEDGSFDNLKQLVAMGPTDAKHFGDGAKDGLYHNANYALFRIIIPYMMYGQSSIESGPDSIDVATSKLYVKFVQDNVLTPAGLSGVGVGSSGSMVYYDMDDLSQTWGGYSDDYGLTHCGANCWVLSAKEYGTFITALQNGKIVKAATFQHMQNDQLGMGGGAGHEYTTTGGDNWNHNGGLTWNGAGIRGDWMILPHGVTVVVLVNSQAGNLPTTFVPDGKLPRQFESFIPWAWNAAW